MTSRRRVLALLLGFLLFGPSDAAPASAETQLVIGYLLREGDPAYEPHRAYTGLRLRDRHPAVDGARLAVRESRILGRALGIAFELIERRLAPEEDAAAALRALEAAREARIFVLDLPLAETKAAVAAMADRPVLLFNPRHRDNALRGSDCAPVLFHTVPSDAMLTDGLAQYARSKGWTRILALEGPTAADRAWSASFRHSARKFGLKLVEIKGFVLSNDPRRREETNIPLLTGETDYDLVFVADAEGEFGRYVPYQTYHPRPVMGSEGLVPAGWHWTWERHGAPQLNQRFERLAGRHMTETDWAAWAAVKTVVEAVTRTRSTDLAAIRAFLLSEAFTFDAYKGAPGSFRPWNRQLRQPVLLHTHNAVIVRAPIEGFLHEGNTLDTLGPDERESRCE